jgi:DNA polymerase-3 subunit beta
VKLTVDRAALVRELQFLHGAIGKSTTIPILSHILAEAEGERLTLTATNLDLAIRGSCAAKVSQAGSMALPGARFLDYVKLLAGADVTLERQANDGVAIVCGRSRAKMAAMSHGSWPVLPSMPTTDIEMEAGALATLIARTDFAISLEESRFTLDGGSFSPGYQSLVATDGHRLAFAGPDGKGPRILVPRKALAQALKLAAANSGTVRFAHEGNYLFFDFGDRLLISRELSGNFPDYRRVLPKEAAHTVEIDRLELKGALERVAEFSDEASNAVRIAVRAGELVVSAKVTEVGESEESVPVSFDSPETIEIGFRAEYLLDFLKAVTCDKVLFSFTNATSAGEFRPMGDDGYRYVVMPMRILPKCSSILKKRKEPHI